MSNLRKILGTLLGLSLFIFLLYKPFGLIRLPFFALEAFEAIPAQTLLFLEEDYKTLTIDPTANQLTESALFKEDLLVNKYQEDLRYIRAVFSRHTAYQQRIRDKGRLVSALQHGAAEGLDFLHIIDQYEGQLDLEQLLDALNLKKIRRSVYRGVSIHTLHFTKGRSFVISQFRNLILLGRYPLIIEDAIEQLKKPYSNLLREKNFRKLRKQKPAEGIRFYVNMGSFSSFLLPFVRYEKRAFVQKLHNQGNWLQFDVNSDQTSVRLSGQFYPDAKHTTLQMLKEGKASMHHQITGVLPDHTALALRLDAHSLFKKQRENENSLVSDFDSYILPWVQGEMAYAITKPYSSTYQDEQFVLMKVNEEKTALRGIARFAEKSGELKAYDYQTYPIRQILANGLFLPLLGENLNVFHNPFVTLVGDYAVFCNSRQALEVLLDKYIAGQTLSRNADFLQSSIALPETSGLLLYLHPQHLQSLVVALFKNRYQDILNTAFEQYNDLDHIRLQFEAKKSCFKMEGRLHHRTQDDILAGVIWKTPLRAEAAIAPAILRDPVSDEYQIFIQDVNHQAYLLNRGGDILWTKTLESKILSVIHQIDYYQNGDYQLLFNTAGGIHLIDRNGEDLSKFPIRMQSPATNGLTVIDFDGLGDYGYFVACENGNLYGFEATGRPLTGWNPQPDIGKVKHPLRHFEQAGRDYILALNEEGRLYVFKKDGSRRFAPKSFESRFISPLDFQADDLYTRIVATDQEGTARVVNMKGSIHTLPLDVGNNEDVQFAFADVVGDVRKDYVVMSGKELAAYAYEGNAVRRVFDYLFEEEQDRLFDVSHPNRQKQIVGTLCRDKKQIYLLDEQGAPLPSFPLAGTTTFEVTDLFDDQKNVVVVGFEDQLYAYTIE